MPLHVPLLDNVRLQARLAELKVSKGPAPWIERIVLTDAIHVTVVCQNPGPPNDRHYHRNEETWFVVEGELLWFVDGHDQPLQARAGDFIFAPREQYHQIQVVGSGPSIRIVIGTPDDPHLHDQS